MPIRPNPSEGNPCPLTACQCSPPSFERYNPLPGPFEGG